MLFWWQSFRDKLFSFLSSRTKFPGHNSSVSFCPGLSLLTLILLYCVSDGYGVEGRVCCKHDLFSCFSMGWMPPILPWAARSVWGGGLIAVPSDSLSFWKIPMCPGSAFKICETHRRGSAVCVCRDRKPI